MDDFTSFMKSSIDPQHLHTVLTQIIKLEWVTFPMQKLLIISPAENDKIIISLSIFVVIELHQLQKSLSSSRKGQKVKINSLKDFW